MPNIRESIETHRAAGYGDKELAKRWYDGDLIPRDEHETALRTERQNLLAQARPVRHVNADDVFDAIPVRVLQDETLRRETMDIYVVSERGTNRIEGVFATAQDAHKFLLRIYGAEETAMFEVREFAILDGDCHRAVLTTTHD